MLSEIIALVEKLNGTLHLMRSPNSYDALIWHCQIKLEKDGLKLEAVATKKNTGRSYRSSL